MTQDDVFKIINSDMYIKGELVENDAKLKIKEEANRIFYGDVWDLVNKKLNYEAEKLMFNKSVSTDDLFVSKAMIYDLNLINEYLKQLSQLK